MILDTTTDSIEVKLGAAATTRGMQYYVSYHTIDSTNKTFVPTKGIGTTNGTTAVTIVPAPASGKINQLRFCSVHNCDTVEQTVTIQINSSSSLRIVFSAILKVGEQIQFTLQEGWKVFNMDGILKTSNSTIGGTSGKFPSYVNHNLAGITMTSGTTYASYLGKADRNYNFVYITLTVLTALGATINWAEAAIYKGYPTIASNLTLTRCGWVDISQGTQYGINNTGTNRIEIPINYNTGDSNINIGDDIWFVIGFVNNGTAAAIRGMGIADTLGTGVSQTVTGSLRPSTNTSISFTVSTSTPSFYVPWQGIQTI